jgi:hypothetical protein
MTVKQKKATMHKKMNLRMFTSARKMDPFLLYGALAALLKESICLCRFGLCRSVISDSSGTKDLPGKRPCIVITATAIHHTGRGKTDSRKEPVTECKAMNCGD